MTELDPIKLFAREYRSASATEPFEASRCALATADESGRPTVRFVLLKGFDEEGFVFFCNYNSPKATHMDANPYAEVAFHWHTTGVQVRARGTVAKVSDIESDTYFATRDRGSQLGAWASRQSAILQSHEALQHAVEEVACRFEGESVPRPFFWGGYRIDPDAIEFWYNRDDRLHDRWLYSRSPGASWRVMLLYP